MIDISTGKQLTRRDFGKGLAAILAAGVAPALSGASTGGLRRGLAMKLSALSTSEDKEDEMYKELYFATVDNTANIVEEFVDNEIVIGRASGWRYLRAKYVTMNALINIGTSMFQENQFIEELSLPNATNIGSYSLQGMPSVKIMRLNKLKTFGSSNIGYRETNLTDVYLSDVLYSQFTNFVSGAGNAPATTKFHFKAAGGGEEIRDKTGAIITS